MKLNYRSVFVAMLLSSVLAGCSKKKAKSDESLKEFNGVWQVIEVNERGKPARTDLIRNMTANIDNGQFKLTTVSGSGNSEASGTAFTPKEIPLQDLYESTITMDQSKTPAEVDFVFMQGEHQGKTRLGIFALEGIQLKICLADINAARPTDFVAKAGTALIKLERKP